MFLGLCRHIPFVESSSDLPAKPGNGLDNVRANGPGTFEETADGFDGHVVVLDLVAVFGASKLKRKAVHGPTRHIWRESSLGFLSNVSVEGDIKKSLVASPTGEFHECCCLASSSIGKNQEQLTGTEGGKVDDGLLLFRQWPSSVCQLETIDLVVLKVPHSFSDIVHDASNRRNSTDIVRHCRSVLFGVRLRQNSRLFGCVELFGTKRRKHVFVGSFNGSWSSRRSSRGISSRCYRWRYVSGRRPGLNKRTRNNVETELEQHDKGVKEF